MRRFHFDEATPGTRELELSGQAARGRIYRAAPGVWRVLLSPRQGAAKRAVAALPGPEDALSMEARRQGAGFLLAGGGEPLTVELAPLALSWNGVRAEAGRRDPGLALRWEEAPGRRYAGLGERAHPLPLPRERRYRNWTTDAANYAPGDDPLYQAHPFLFALEEDGRAWGLFLDESWPTDVHLGAAGERSRARTRGPTLDLYLIEGPDPKGVLARFSALVGRAPMPPLWALGYHQCRWGYRDEAEVRRVVRGFRENDLPLDAIWLDIDYMDGYRVFRFHPERFPAPAKLVESLRGEGVRTVVIVDPGVKVDSDYAVWLEGRESGFFVNRNDGRPYVGACWPEDCAWPDFSREEVRAWWGRLHRSYLEAGIAGIWNDMNEPANLEGGKVCTLPDDADHGGRTHAELHNLYGLHMCRATREGLEALAPERRPFVLTRSGFSGIQRYAWVWTGDNSSSFEHMALSIPMLLHLGLSGVPYAGADVGGFAGDCSGELLARWSWLGALYPLFRNHSAWDTVRQEPWLYGEPYLSAIRKALRFRYRLLPYLYTLAREAAATGIPILRPLFFADPLDPRAAERADQLLVGDDLLAAPALASAQREREVYLPAGRWQDFWTGAWHQGPGTVRAKTPLDRLPLFQRAGSAIPLAADDARPEEARWPALRWRVAPAAAVAGRLYEDGGDGPADGADSELEGRAEGSRLKLRFRDRSGLEGREPIAEILGGEHDVELEIDRGA